MLVAVTGATGFLGRYIVHRLAAAGHRLRCWYRPSSDRGGFETISATLEWLPGNLGDGPATAALVQGADAVVHAGIDYRPGNPQGPGDIRPFLEANLMGSLLLLQTARAAGVPRFVFISSYSVNEVILPDRRLDETHPLWSVSHYGAHKAALEKFVHSYGLGQGWPICALRPTGIYGLAHPPHRSRWFDMIGQVLRGEPVASAAGGERVHAADVARAVEVLLGADAKTIAGQAYNCNDGYIADQEVAALAKQMTGSASTIADLNRGPQQGAESIRSVVVASSYHAVNYAKRQLATDKIRSLGMTFGGAPLLRQTVAELIRAASAQPNS